MFERKQRVAIRLFENKKYLCTKTGRIYSLMDNHNFPRATPLLMKTKVKKMYERVMLSDYGRNRLYAGVHQLVWLFFRGEFDPKLQINHRDGNKLNNRLENLEVVTPKENTQHSLRLGLKPRDWNRRAFAKLTEEQVRKIKKHLEVRILPQAEIARMFGVDRTTVWHIKKGNSWKEVT